MKKVKTIKKFTGNEIISNTDPLGSYTGVPEKGQIPTQDADDL